ncbi:hypothetical protein DSM106972_098070 [Dulcicalothrix desertica PCC 7102]|uniref:NACHT domain-containing protein n=2 Tax=Dulcicalothrix desertica TaxID=32056 RepID=A0A3S1BPJ7_9CYAN|nr:hypothetical protein DSM106972_098070 [Dulcicalothrix desertica PCC 7102]
MGLMAELQSGKESSERLPVLEGICKYAREHVLLVGKPGSGKSTALQHLLWEEARNASVIPVLVELRSWLLETASVIQLIQKIFQRNRLRLNEDKIEDLLFDGKLLLLFDGLNELPSDESRRLVAEFRSDFPQTPMIFTTRDLGVGGDLGIKKQLSMQPLTSEQMRAFIRAYLPKQGEEMLRQLGDRLQELGETPLILKMLCDVFNRVKQIPNSRGGLFRYFDREFDQLKGQVAVTEKLRQWKPELLQHLAFTMMQGEKPRDLRLIISRTEAEYVLEEFLKDRVDSPGEKAKYWLQDLLKHYLIQTVDEKHIQFHHQLFQEYYAAEYLLRLLPSLSDDELKHNYLNLLKWTEPLALILALLDNEALAVKVVQLALDVDLMLGARLAGEVKREFQKKTVDLILEKKLHKELEIELLGSTRSKLTIAYLNIFLKHEDLDVCKSAVIALGNIGDKSAVNPLINALKHEDLSVRMCAADAFGQIRDEAAVNPLIDVLKHEDSDVRSFAADALGQIGDEAAVNSLIDALKDKDLSVRMCAADALGKIGDKAAVNPLIDALKHEDLYVCSSAVIALGKIGDKAAVNPLIDALEHKDLSVRIFAAIALGKIGGEAAVNPLINALKDKDLSVCKDAVYALGEIGEESAVNPLVDALKDENSWDCIFAAIALGKIGKEAAVNLLINALKDEDLDVRMYAVETLGEIGGEAAVNPLIDALKNEDSNVRSSAAISLGKIATDSNLSQLWNMLLNKNYREYGFVQDIISQIQERYKFYNYEIFRSPLVFDSNKIDLVNSQSSITHNYYPIFRTSECRIKYYINTYWH